MINSLNYMFQDKNLVPKAALIFVIVTISTILGLMQNRFGIILSSVISGILSIFILGYFYDCIRAVKTADYEVNIPNLNPAYAFLIGIKAAVGIFLLSVVTGFLSFFLYYIPLMIMLFFFPALANVFSTETNSFSFFNFKKALEIMKNNYFHYLLTLLKLMAVYSLAGAIMLFVFGLLGVAKGIGALDNMKLINAAVISIIFSFIYTYGLFVIAFLIGNIYKENIYEVELVD